MRLDPYLNFGGDCADAFRLYQSVLGGTLQMMTHGDSPMAAQTPPEMKNHVMHARLEVGDQVLMGSDAPINQYQPGGNNFVSCQVSSVEEADRVFGGLAEGAKILMPLAETFWSPRFGMLVDRFGVPWMVNFDPRG